MNMKYNLDDLIHMLENGVEEKLVSITIEDELIGLVMPPETLLSLLKNDNEFINYYIFDGPIQSIEHYEDVLIVKL